MSESNTVQSRFIEVVDLGEEDLTSGILHPDIHDLTYEKRVQRAAVNSSTDTGVGFEAGNIPIALGEGVYAAIPSSIVGLAALAARATYEFRRGGLRAPFIQDISVKLQSSRLTNNPVTNNPVTRWVGSKVSSLFNKMVDNPNVGIEVSATGLAASSLSIPIAAAITGNPETLETLYHWGQEETILGLFSVGNAFNGSSSRFDSTVVQNAMKAVGTTAATTGVMMTGGDLENVKNMITCNPEALSEPNTYMYGILMLAAAQSIWQIIKNTGARRLLQPQLMFGMGCFANGAINFSEGNTEAGIANMIWTAAFVSLDAVFKNGGLHQKYFTRKSAQDPELDPVEPS